jgi:DNA-binding CsgD family transcriptional regulator
LPIAGIAIRQKLIVSKERSNWLELEKEQKHPHLKQLTKVEQRVYVLAQSDYRPKDIANMLGYSVQYVRNVKSRIRKKLDLDRNWGAD